MMHEGSTVASTGGTAEKGGRAKARGIGLLGTQRAEPVKTNTLSHHFCLDHPNSALWKDTSLH